MLANRLMLTATVSLAVAYLTAWPANADFHTKTGDVNTVDPAVNNFTQGMSRLKNKDVDGAIDSFQQSIDFARNAYNPGAYYWLGMCYKIKHQDGKAIEALKKHLEQTTAPSPNGHVDLGEIYMRNDRDKEAEQCFDAALGEAGAESIAGGRAHNALGKLDEKHNELTSANWHFVQALSDPPWHYAEAWQNLIENDMKRGDFVEAIQQTRALLARQLSKSPLRGVNYAKLNCDLGVCKMAKGDHQGAMQAWQQACINDQMFAEPHILLAKLFDEEKHITSAIHEYEKYIALAPNERGIEQVKARMEYLESLVKPVEAPAQAAKPSPFMRQELQKQVERQQQQADQYQREMEQLKGAAQDAQPKDSGF